MFFSDSNNPCQDLLSMPSYKPHKNISVLGRRHRQIETRLSLTIATCAELMRSKWRHRLLSYVEDLCPVNNQYLLMYAVGCRNNLLGELTVCSITNVTGLDRRLTVTCGLRFVFNSHPCSQKLTFPNCNLIQNMRTADLLIAR